MRPEGPERITDAVISQLESEHGSVLSKAPERVTAVMKAAIRHLHAFVREERPTEAEWLATIKFLTDVGQRSNDKRNDFILLSDLLGVSALIDMVDHEVTAPGITESTVLGPFFVPGARRLEHGAIVCDMATGTPTVIVGRVVDEAGNPLAGATVDVWQTDGSGEYDVQHRERGDSTRGQLRTGLDGEFWFRTVKPMSYPVPTDGPVGELHVSLGRPTIRPAHIHFMIRAEGCRDLTTHLFVAGDQYLDRDPVFGVKASLIVPFRTETDAQLAKRWQVPSPFCFVEHSFRLARQQQFASQE